MITVKAGVKLREGVKKGRDSHRSCAPLDDVCDGAGKHLKTLWHLERHHGGLVFADVMNCLVDLE